MDFFFLSKPPNLLSALLFFFFLMRSSALCGRANPSFLLARFTVKRYSSHDVGFVTSHCRPRGLSLVARPISAFSPFRPPCLFSNVPREFSRPAFYLLFLFLYLFSFNRSFVSKSPWNKSYANKYYPTPRGPLNRPRQESFPNLI